MGRWRRRILQLSLVNCDFRNSLPVPRSLSMMVMRPIQPIDDQNAAPGVFSSYLVCDNVPWNLKGVLFVILARMKNESTYCSSCYCISTVHLLNIKSSNSIFYNLQLF